MVHAQQYKATNDTRTSNTNELWSRENVNRNENCLRKDRRCAKENNNPIENRPRGDVNAVENGPRENFNAN